MSHDEKLLLLRILDQYTDEEVKTAIKRFNTMNAIEQDEAQGR